MAQGIHISTNGNRELLFDARGELAKLAKAQRRMVPQFAPEMKGYKLKLAYRPAYIATGDYCDFFIRQDQQVATFVGDGSGHGPAAAMVMATMRTILRTHPDLHRDPGRTLTSAGSMFHSVIPPDLFMTGVYLVFGDEGRISWAAAGQDPPLRVNRLGQVARVDIGPVGLPLGIDPEEEYASVVWDLRPGERLVLYTDGLVEARNSMDEPFGRLRLQFELAALARLSLDDMVDQVLARATAHAEGADFEDDFSILAIERDEPERL
jgi:sigma-B regulation protein RsbU (phosphoserine phosphatase)